MTEFVLRFLGTYQVSADASPVIDFHSDKVRALLAYLALEPHEHTRAELAALLWPEIADQLARTNLRNTLHRLRQTLEAAAPGSSTTLLTVSRQSIGFNLAHATVDVHKFLAAINSAQSSTATPNLDQWDAGAMLYGGELLAGFGVADAPVFEEWLLLHRELLHQQALVTMHKLTTAYETAGNDERAYTVANRLLVLEPLHEATHRQLMRLLARMGQPNRALEQLERLRQLLHQEMSVAPAAETLALAQQIASGAFDGGQDEGMTGRQDDKMKGGQDNRAAGHLVTPSSLHLVTPSSTLDLSEVPMPGVFFGRERERQQIIQWLAQERCQVVAILGIGGMGKTTLTAQCVRELASQENAPFEALYWRSLVNAPPLDELLPPLLQALSDQQLPQIPTHVDEQLRLLLDYLRGRRLLLVLDNMESILEPGAAGTYRPGYEPYGQLIQQVATLNHQSHLVLTSRERPRGYQRLARDGHPVYSLSLTGLDHEAGHQLFRQRGVLGKREQEALLIARYSGNPLALKLVADTVDEIFGGDVAEFLADDTLIFDDIRAILDQHFARLTDLEQQVLFWLAIEREVTPLATLRNNLLTPPPQRLLLETLRSLQHRSLVEQQEGGFALQNVVTEYLTDRLVERAITEIIAGELDVLHRHPLLKAQAKEYIRQSQARMFLKPIAEQLRNSFSMAASIAQLQQILAHLSTQSLRAPSYAGGNLLNLLRYLDVDISGYDFSRLAIWQADLQGATLHSVNFSQADLKTSTFTDNLSQVYALDFSPSGELLAVGMGNGTIVLYRLADGQQALHLTGHTNRVEAVIFSPDGQQLVSGSLDATIRIWDAKSGGCLNIITTHQSAVHPVAMHPQGDMIATGGEDKTICLWNIRSGQLLKRLEQHTDGVKALVFDPTGQLLASGGDSQIHVWHVQTLLSDPADTAKIGKPAALTSTLHGHLGKVASLTFSPDGRLLASGGSDAMVHLWDVKTGSQINALHGHTNWVRALTFIPHDTQLITSDADGTVYSWDYATGSVRNTFVGHTNAVWCLTLNAQGTILATGGQDGTVRLWDLQERMQNRAIKVFQGYVRHIRSIAFSPNETMLASGDSRGIIHLWNLEDGERSIQINQSLAGHSRSVTAVVFSPDGQWLASGSDDSLVCLWEVATGGCITKLSGHANAVHQLAFAPNGRRFASAGRDGEIHVWEMQALGQVQLVHLLQGHTFPIHGLTFSPDSERLISSSSDDTIRVWDLTQRQCIQIFRGISDPLNVVFLPEEVQVAVASTDTRIYILPWVAGQLEQPLYSFAGHTSNIRSMASNDQGRYLVSCSADATIRLWDVQTRKPHHTLLEREQAARVVALATDGSMFASGGFDGLIKLWQVEDGLCLHTLQIPPPYEGMNITATTGITDAQRTALKALGAVEA